MRRVGLINGSAELPWSVQWSGVGSTETEFGQASAQPEITRVGNCEVVRLMRHGVGVRDELRGAIAPHAVNYRANLALLQSLEVGAIVALNTVGGIHESAATGSVVIPDQIIDYTWGRAQTFNPDDDVRHIDFSTPFDRRLRQQLLQAARQAATPVVDGGVMGVTQGPRLETAAEIDRMDRDGCTVVGMTGMPEAALARELGIPFASVCLVVNPAAGRAGESIDLAVIEDVASQGMIAVGQLLWLLFFEIFESLE
jgi:5'-methylthioinosine phosphorylase